MTQLVFKKHSRYLLQKIKAAMMQLFEYRVNMFSTTLATYGYNIVSLIFLNVLFENIDSIAGWGRYEIILLWGVIELVLGLYWAFFASVERVSEMIRDGSLDRFLPRPISTLLDISTQKITLFEGMPLLVLSLGIIAFAWTKLSPNFGFNVVIFPVTVLLSVTITTLVPLSISLLAFWLTDTGDLERLYEQMMEFARYPIGIYPEKLRFIFTTFIPTAILAYVPAHTLLYGFNKILVLYQVVALVLFSVAVKVLWTRGLKRYQSAGG